MAKKRSGNGSVSAPGGEGPEKDIPRQFHPPIEPVHGQKIDKLLAHRKTPATDRPRVQAAKEKYREWVKEMDELTLEGEALLMNARPGGVPFFFERIQ